jgi:hypothetical protein
MLLLLPGLALCSTGLDSTSDLCHGGDDSVLMVVLV